MTASDSFAIDWRIQRRAMLVAAIVCGALAWWHRGDALSVIFLTVLLLVPVVPVALVCLIASGLRFAFNRSRIGAGSMNVALALSIVAAAVPASIVPGGILGSIDLTSAENWAVELAPRIESYREQHGSYPASLHEVTNFEGAPRLIRHGELGYHAGVDRFYLYLPVGFMDDIGWSSVRRVWTREKLD